MERREALGIGDRADSEYIVYGLPEWKVPALRRKSRDFYKLAKMISAAG